MPIAASRLLRHHQTLTLDHVFRMVNCQYMGKEGDLQGQVKRQYEARNDETAVHFQSWRCSFESYLGSPGVSGRTGRATLVNFQSIAGRFSD